MHIHAKHYPTALLKTTAQLCAAKTFSHDISEARKCELYPTLSSCLGIASGHGKSQGTPLDCLVVITKRTGIPKLQGTVTIGKIVLGKPPTPGNAQMAN